MRNTYLILLLLLFALSASFLITILQKKISSPEQRIRQVLSRTRWKNLADFIIAQAKAETGNFTSRLFVEQNNPFGMKNAVLGRAGRQLGYPVPGTDFRAYSSVEQATEDFVDWLEYTRFPTSIPGLESYVTEMKNRGYFEEDYQYYLDLMEQYYA